MTQIQLKKKPPLFGTEAYALPPAAKSHILRVFVLSRITSFKHGWWFWTVALQKPSIWHFYHCTFIKASPPSKLPGVWGSDLWEKRKKKVPETVLIGSVFFFFSSARSLFQTIPWFFRKSSRCKNASLLSFLGTDWQWSWPEPTQLLLKVLVFSAKNYLQAVRSEANRSAQFILM